MKARLAERLASISLSKIVWADREIACVVRDISPNGAKVLIPELAAALRVPEQFELFVAETGEYRPALVRWRRGQEVGVSFMPDRRSAPRHAAPGM